MKKAHRPYLAPFIAFLVLTYAGTLIPHGTYMFYPIKTLVVASLLFFYRKHYTEISLRFSWLGIVAGIVVFILWIAPENLYPGFTQIGSSEFNPYTYGTGWLAYVLIGFRLAGAVLLVPVLEELFWRSWALRWLIDDDFQTIPLGTFTWFSFGVVVVGFGFEHHRWLAGLLAGVAYNGLLYAKKDLGACIQAHAVTNLLLGLYVLMTQQWSFW